MKTVYDHCENCGEETKEDDLQEVRIKYTRLHIFVCEECAEDLENFTVIL